MRNFSPSFYQKVRFFYNCSFLPGPSNYFRATLTFGTDIYDFCDFLSLEKSTRPLPPWKATWQIYTTTRWSTFSCWQPEEKAPGLNISEPFDQD